MVQVHHPIMEERIMEKSSSEFLKNDIIMMKILYKKKNFFPKLFIFVVIQYCHHHQVEIDNQGKNARKNLFI